MTEPTETVLHRVKLIAETKTSTTESKHISPENSQCIALLYALDPAKRTKTLLNGMAMDQTQIL